MNNRRFSSTISIINGNPYVRPPDSVLGFIFKQGGKDKSPIPVRGKLNDTPFQQSLVRYQGDWRLYINGIMAKRAGLSYSRSVIEIVGRNVAIELRFDTTPPTYPMHPQFKKALGKDRTAKIAYDRLTPGRKKEIQRYLGFLKTEATLNRNIKRILQHLHGEKSDALYPLMQRKDKNTKP